MPENDGFYIQRCLDGHPDDFRHLVKRYQGPVTAYLTGQLLSRDLAEEAAQEVMVRCYFGLGSLEKPESFFAWMLGIADRVAKEQYRDRKKQQELTQRIAERPPQKESKCDWPLAGAIAKLEDFYRQLVLLRYYGGHNCRDIAEMMNIPIGTVTKSLSRAYTQLRDALKTEESEVQR